MSDLIRTSIRLTPEMHEWFKKEAESIGIPMNAMIIFALKQYQREETVLPNLPEIMKAMVAASQLSDDERRNDREEIKDLQG